MKRLLFVLMAMIFAIQGWGQTPTTVTIGSGTGTSSYVPLYGYYEYSYSQQIYNQTEINAKGQITKIRLYYSSGSYTNTTNWTVYLGHTTKTSFSSTSDWVPVSTLTQVFSGTVTYPATGNWLEITLSTPFSYNNVDNLILAVDENEAGDCGSSSQPLWGSFTGSPSYRGLYKYIDGTNIDPASPPTGTRTSIINQVQFDVNEPCLRPTTLVSSNTTTNSSTFSWTNGTSTDASWLLYYKKTSDVNYNCVNVSSNPYTLTGLLPDNDYNAYLKTNCLTDTSVSTSTVNFTTLPTCPAPTNLNINASNLSAHAAILNWTAGGSEPRWNIQYKLSSKLSWDSAYSIISTSNSKLLSTSLIEHANYDVRVRGICGVGDTSRWSTTYNFLTPYAFPAPSNLATFDSLTTYSSAKIHWKKNGTETQWAIEYKLSTISDWDYATTLYSNDTNFTFTDLTENTTYNVKVRAICGNNDSVVYSSPITFTTLYYCQKPTNFAINDASITTTSAELGWTSHGHDSQWTIEYKKRLDDWTNAQTAVASTNPYTLNGLQPGTIYNIRIKSICDQGVSSVSNIDTCVTACEMINSLPWAYSFDDNGTGTTIFPTCWTKITTNSYYPYIATTNSSSPGSMFFTSTATTYNIAITPRISDAISINTLRAKFKLYKTVSTYNITVGLISDPSNAATFDSITTLTPTALSTWQDFEVSFASYSGTGKYIAFKSQTSASNAIYLDNLQISLLPTCFEPKNLASSNITYSSAKLTWTKGTNETQWEIQYKISTDTNWANATTITTTIDTAYYLLTGLNELTTYNVRIKALCSTEGSIYSNIINITTPAACPPPTTIVTNTGGNKAIINWTAGGSETQWLIQYKISTDTNWANATSINAFSKPDTIIGLNPLTTYNVRVKGICDQTHQSVWSSITNFTTINGIPFTENFASTTYPPTNWTKLTGLASSAFSGTLPSSTTSGWTRVTTGYGISNAHPKVNIYGTGCKYWLVTPSIDLGSNSNAALSFDLARTAYGSSSSASQTGTDDKFMVIISSDNGATWTQANATIWDNAGSSRVYNNISNSAQTVIINLSSYVNKTIKVAFYGESTTSNADNDLHIGNVKIDIIPTCPQPTGLASNSITTSGATINWTNGGSETAWTVQYKPSSDTNWNNATSVIATTNPFTLTNLNQLTSYNVRIKANCSANDMSLYSNIINFTTLPTCPIPIGLAYDTISVTTTSARVYWTAGGTETAWNLQYKLSTDTSWTAINTTTNSYILTGLTNSSSYNVRIKAVCSPTDTSLWSNIINFNTNCDVISVLPWSDYFDNYGTLTYPLCWSKTTTYSTYPYFSTTNNSAPKSLYFYLNSLSGYEIACTPQFDASINLSTLRVKFKLYSSSSSTRIKVGIMVNPADSTTFSQIAEVHPSATSTWQDFEVQFNSYTGNGKYIAFKFTTLSTYTSMYIDNVEVSVTPTCFEPTALRVTNNNTTSVSLNWTPSGSATAWTIQYKPSSETSWSNATTINVTNDTTYSLTGLQIASSYDWRIKTVCSPTDQSPWSNPSSFSTLSLTSSIPFISNFDDNNQNSNYWIINNGTQTNKWFIGNLGGRTGNGLYISDNANGSTLNYNISNSSIVFASTKLQFGNAKNYALSFDWKAYGESSSYDFINVYLIPTYVTLVPGTLPSSTYALATNINLDSTWKTKRITISGASLNDSIRNLVFVWDNDASGGNQPPAAIDNIKVTDCVAPSGLLVDATTITSSTATIRWKAGNAETAWNVEYKLQNDSVWTTINNVNDTNYTLTNIRHTSIYNVRVKAVCDQNNQSDDYSNVITINTDCGAYDPLTLSTTFATMLPNNCWEKKVGLLTNLCTPTPTTGGWIASTVLPGYAKATMYRNNKSWLITPALDLGQGNIFYQLEFDAALTTFASNAAPNRSNFDDKFILAISNDNGETWSSANVCRMYDQNGNPLTLNTLNPTPTHVYVKLVYDNGTPFTGNVKLGFYVESTIANAVNDLHINNISFSTYCPEPTAISTLPYTDRVDVSWTGNTNKANLEVKLNNGTPIAINNVNNYTFTNLSQANQYTVSVRTVCSNTNQYSEWVSKTFSTESAPQVVTNDATLIKETSATLNGSVIDGSEAIIAKGFEYKLTSATEWTRILGTTQPLVYELTNLVNGSDYQFRAFVTTQSYTFYGTTKTIHTPTAPQVTTNPATSILQSSVTLNGNIIAGEETISNYGFEYREVNSATWTSIPVNASPLTYLLTNLPANTNYEFKAFATTNSGTTYGLAQTFTTPTPFTLTTNEVTNLAQNSATINATLIPGSEEITSFGFEWKVSSASEYTDIPLSNINNFTYDLTGLTLNQHYNVRPYAVTISGKVYGNEISFMTLNPPTVNTTIASNITQTSALLNATIIEGTDVMSGYGIQWKLASDENWTEVSLPSFNPLTYSLTGLTANTLYTYRAYAKVGIQPIYGDAVNFTTLTEGINQPTVTTSTTTNITQTSAIISGNIVSGDRTILSKGFEWKYANIANWTVISDEDLSINLNNLTPNTSFNVRTYAITEDGRSYGSIETFRTLATEPVTLTISSINQTSANISWSSMTNAIGYRINVYQEGVLMAGYPQLITSTNFNLTSLRSNSNFTVKVETEYTPTTFSAITSNDFRTLQYIAPAVSITNITQTSLTASWTGNQTSGARFNISLYKGTTLIHEFLGQTASSMTLDLLIPSTNYTINVTEIYNTDELSVTATASENTLATEIPIVSDTNIAYNSVTINWSVMNNVIGYKVYLYNGNGDIIDSAFVNQAYYSQGPERNHVGLHVTFNGLSSSTNYSVNIFGIYQGNIFSDPIIINFSTPYYEYPKPIYIRTSNIAPTSVTLNGRVSAGEEPTNIKGFLYKEIGATNWDSVVVGVADTNFKYNLSGLSVNSLYQVRVFAKNPSGTFYSPIQGFRTGKVNVIVNDANNRIIRNTTDLNNAANFVNLGNSNVNLYFDVTVSPISGIGFTTSIGQISAFSGRIKFVDATNQEVVDGEITIDRLSIPLFGDAINAYIENINLTNVSITGRKASLVEFADNTTIKNCNVVNGSVNATSNNAGGLAGEITNCSKIEECSANINVTGLDYVGGLVGNNTACAITKSYSTGNVAGNNYVGGFAGYNQGGTIFKSYSTGNVNSTTVPTINVNFGAFVGGGNGNETICYWLETILSNINLNIPNAIYNYRGTPKNAIEVIRAVN